MKYECSYCENLFESDDIIVISEDDESYKSYSCVDCYKKIKSDAKVSINNNSNNITVNNKIDL